MRQTSYNRGGRGHSGANRFSNSASTGTTPLAPDRDIMEGLVPTALQTIGIPTTVKSAQNVTISSLQSVGSYNWTKNSSPTIIVPGSPAEWQNKATPYQVPADTGLFFIDQNGFRMPSAVLLPLITAVDATHEASGSPAAFDWAGANFDFITDRNGLRKLMRWIDGANRDADSDPPKEFRIDTQLAGRTVLLNRWEKRTRENLSGYTYGFNFEKASTDPAIGCEDSTGHHRMVSYDLNGLKMLVRFEVDACIPAAAKASAKKKVQSIDDLATSLAGVNLASRGVSTSTTNNGLTVISDGAIIPHTSLVELTTRTERRAAEFDWKDAYPQLFFSQTPHHFLAVHDRGRFTSVTKRTLESSDLQAVQHAMQPSLKKLRAALDTIRDVVVKNGQRGRLTLVYRDGKLEVFQRTSSASCLPDHILARFES
ncbi:hypothetical protein GGX14DRAFT_372230 [Mycena pura]|uniref:Geranylgeranyl pyrophosphate synthetase n=1 Tax=Mycena pura TaxID=153505 RepID=A0AAD6V5H6_9AGAR|nr:hypothetical protein GGX14DRAFT_372230 [Mycena pura]